MKSTNLEIYFLIHFICQKKERFHACPISHGFYEYLATAHHESQNI